MATPTTTTTKPKQAKKQAELQRYMRTWFIMYYKHATLGACAVLLLLGIFFVIRPKYRTAQSVAQSRYEELLSEQLILEKRLGYVAQVQADRAQVYEGDIERIHVALPSSPATAELITSVEAIAQQSNVIVEGIELAIIDPADFTGFDSGGIQAIPGGAHVVEISLGVTSGPYDNLKQFLASLEKSLRLLDVIAITYSPTGKTYNVIVRAYFLPE